jgi:hypothetical protein
MTRHRLARILRQRWLRIKGIHMRWAAIEEEVDHPLRLRREMRLRRLQIRQAPSAAMPMPERRKNLGG